MSNQAIIADTKDLLVLRGVLQKYRELSRKSWADILAKETNEWRFELWGGQGTHGVGFKTISPTPNQIVKAAIDRKFQVKRAPNAITKVEDGISRAASAAADSLLGTQKSDYFRVEVNENGVFIKPARFSKAGRMLKGGRSGRRFSDKAQRINQLSEKALRRVEKADPDIKQLNRRALGVAIELGLRSRASKGGTMALQWLGANFSRRKSATVKGGPIVIRSTKGIPLGLVEFEGDGDLQTATLTGFVPGTARQALKHNIVERVAQVRVADRLEYITRKLDEAKKAALS